MRVTAEQMAGQIASRESMAEFLDTLSQDAVEHASEWENLHIFDMLESMSAWLRDTTSHESFAQQELPPAHLAVRGSVAASRQALRVASATFALRLAVVIRVVGDVRRRGEGPDRAAS
jgi:hypothetical protein